jgi:ribokinase
MIINFGSLNIDHVYRLDHIVKPGETIAASDYAIFAGGKGANQSMAVAQAGAAVRHVGKIGPEGRWMLERLKSAGVDVSSITVSDKPGGHAIIEVDKNGQNAIVIHGGTNTMIATDEIDAALASAHAGDLVLIQNEINNIPYIIETAHAKGLPVCLNPAPMDPGVIAYPLAKVSIFVINETEGQALTGKDNPKSILDEMRVAFPTSRVVLTLGAAGAVYTDEKERIRAEGHKVKAVDTTGAGDTFIGYFLAALASTMPVQACLEIANMAAAIAVTQRGASKTLAKIGALALPEN